MKLISTILLITTIIFSCNKQQQVNGHSSKSNCIGLAPLYPQTEYRHERPGFKLFATAVSSSSIVVSWKGSRCYPVYRVDGTLLSTSSCGSFTDTGLMYNTVYGYTVNGVTVYARTQNTNQPPNGGLGVIYLAHDGYLVRGTSWNYNGDFYATPSGHTQYERDSIQRVFESEFIEYGINVVVTQDSNIFNAAHETGRQAVVFTSYHEWYGTSAGGVSFIPGFGLNRPCFVFTRLMGYRLHNSIFVSVHECGHALGLWHWGCNQPNGYSMEANWMGGNYNYQVWERFFGIGEDNRCTVVNQPQVIQTTIQ
jgi:hypothetical protein